ncbi:RICIN domain-containing protein [Luteipulveratus sp. YIM 133132]|uniref:RICIN domain-containing protein n=1 Tax=Luteipulveratus flavus TaxID=3031728 RepID=A0ABT6C1T9_9MICO|nr:MULTISPECIES: RICIN domain-containing protein [unclassified Luteipulveratus]MDE9364770.1 RICIN domain-containing protein [Luteipulveratus sp. YIM 133132]MDF8262673.1 RICIN domain-containing protein [Luteipulveratus sp. YIM 133296]
MFRTRRTPSRRTAAMLASAAALAVAAPALSPAPAQADDRYQYEITNSFSGLKADVIWASTAAYQRVFLWPNNTSASQEFDLLDSGGGYFRIRARHSGQCLMLDWRSGSYGNGTPIIQYPYCSAGYAPAEWTTRWLSGTRCSNGICTTGVNQMLIVNRRTGRCLDAANSAGGRPPVQAMLQEWDCVGSTTDWNIGNQAWDILRPGQVRID